MKTALALIPLLEPIRSEMERVEHSLHEMLAKVEEPLNSMLRRPLDGGKRLRSALVLLVGQMFASPMEPFYRLAIAVEMLHTATLIHDDVVDESPLRRGYQTLHTIWPTGATVLAGDYLLAQAALLIAELGLPCILKVFAETLCTMCAGEIKQMVANKGRYSHRENYYRSIEAKTASLFAATAEMAGILAGAGEQQIAALRHYGWELGIAFQMADDVLDFTGDEARLGKPAGSDLRQGLVTLPAIYYLEEVKGDTVVHAVLSGQRDEESVRAAIGAVCSSGGIEAALAEARVHASQSQEALATLPDNGSRQILRSLANYVVERGY
ncbi:MAG: polyprenyl synthetase family protein [Chloroflexi bacterium]|nr:polyprenyl synthetase family protein [Chloroflexota bacterium]